jgi:hypothetical protein
MGESNAWAGSASGFIFIPYYVTVDHLHLYMEEVDEWGYTSSNPFKRPHGVSGGQITFLPYSVVYVRAVS